ncbi:hypothetical protein P7K49_029874 [Saguinus oedipus]|uniref:Uncharacterized protein n=1 Tax=Saguinus oedipus TaxID=9490 RepID=A0ABQ9U984_SAGOE|nr:hypothetical protein P7K49_029874 [Saguinus oedipus]
METLCKEQPPSAGPFELPAYLRASICNHLHGNHIVYMIVPVHNNKLIFWKEKSQSHKYPEQVNKALVFSRQETRKSAEKDRGSSDTQISTMLTAYPQHLSQSIVNHIRD